MSEGLSFKGDNPYYLLVISDSGEEVVVDLDERNWADQHPGISLPGSAWLLCDKAEGADSPYHHVCLTMFVGKGDKPYYRAKHVGAMVPGAKEIICYGLGKDTQDGSSFQVWLMPNGMIVYGDAVYSVGADIVHGRI